MTAGWHVECSFGQEVDAMPNMLPPTGLPAASGLGFDGITLVWTFIALAMAAGLVLLMWALRAGDRMIYRVRCPEHGSEAIIEVHEPPGGEPGVVRCSLADPPTRLQCGRRCLRLLA
jgi:hypothetical protein